MTNIIAVENCKCKRCGTKLTETHLGWHWADFCSACIEEMTADDEV